MGIQRMIDVTCDYLNCLEITEGSSWTAAEARQRAKEDGWVRRNGLDLCPKHKAVASAAPRW